MKTFFIPFLFFQTSRFLYGSVNIGKKKENKMFIKSGMERIKSYYSLESIDEYDAQFGVKVNGKEFSIKRIARIANRKEDVIAPKSINEAMERRRRIADDVISFYGDTDEGYRINGKWASPRVIAKILRQSGL